MSATELVRLHNDFPQIHRRAVRALQVNLGYRCNQTCFHCHVNAGPNRRENMTRETVDELLALLRRSRIETLDLTGGAPEMNPYFREVVTVARELGIHVIDRCNLTILEEPDYAGTAELLCDKQVEVVASLPCYSSENVDAQRGDGVFEASIAALRRLNALGYGQPDSPLALTLVYNPLGASLPPAQETLEATYRQHLGDEFGIVFTRLFTIANMPINRFAKSLRKEGKLGGYMELLRESHRDANLDAVMCRETLSVDWQGEVYDCDFNQMLHLPAAGRRRHIRDLSLQALEGESIAVADHCFGCTAGQGSSCGGALK